MVAVLDVVVESLKIVNNEDIEKIVAILLHSLLFEMLYFSGL